MGEAADSLKDLVHHIARRCGLRISSSNLPRLEDHVRARQKALRLSRVEDYLQCLQAEHPHQTQEIRLLAEALTTPETFFMRDAGQMQLLRDTVLPRLITARRLAGDLRLRLWSCGCSSGEEAYSLAILLEELLPDIDSWEVGLVGTDINAKSLEAARAASYGAWSFRGCDADFKARHFTQQADRCVLRDSIRRRVAFLPCDVMQDELPDATRSLDRMDLIICRNLFIYFTPTAISTATRKLAACLTDGGYLLTGHGELLANMPPSLTIEMHSQSALYRKVSTPAAEPAQPALSSPPLPPEPLPTTKRTPSTPGTSHRSGTAVLPEAATQATVDGVWKLANRGELEAADSLCRQLQALDPMNAELHYLAGVVALERGDTTTARRALRKALYLDPGMESAQAQLKCLPTGALRS